ncbi:DUF1630-domain-containing protein [Tothia fuscella]|uniref:DUF1630-domain-containing protein n=1 Tax=Tothia fuscella TaxID=1048955 RepID=A0A9P4U2X2_9PEZI|nr:DUF1630-domain-containing protein [Tothia fuscella]
MEKSKGNALLSHDPEWTEFRHWALCFVVCNFNVDVGPEIELVYPETALSSGDLSAITFNSFPERQDTEPAEDLNFHFNIRNNSPDIPLHSPNQPHGSADTLFGSCVFRQEFDTMTKRSYNQKSLVLISNYDFPAFYSRILNIITDMGLISDPSRLEAVCSEMKTWSPPAIGQQSLPLLGYLLSLEIPPHPSFPLQGLMSEPIPGTSSLPFFAYEPVGAWENLLPHMSSITELYVTFEKLVLCEPVIVLSKSPQRSSELVSCLIDLLRPIPYAGPYKPYLTMQSEFFASSQENGLPKHFIVGITNPFLLKRIMSMSTTKGNESTPHIIYLSNGPQKTPLKQNHSRHGRRHSIDLDIPGGIDPQVPTKRYLKSDHTFLNTLDLSLKNPKSGIAPIGHAVRRHFAELSAQILAPLNRFLATNMSSSVPITPGGNPGYANFSEASFLQSLSKYGVAVKFRGQTPLQRHKARDTFYEKFCRSPNFYSWLEMKVTLEREASAGLLGRDAPDKS